MGMAWDDVGKVLYVNVNLGEPVSGLVTPTDPFFAGMLCMSRRLNPGCVTNTNTLTTAGVPQYWWVTDVGPSIREMTPAEKTAALPTQLPTLRAAALQAINQAALRYIDSRYPQAALDVFQGFYEEGSGSKKLYVKPLYVWLEALAAYWDGRRAAVAAAASIAAVAAAQNTTDFAVAMNPTDPLITVQGVIAA